MVIKIQTSRKRLYAEDGVELLGSCAYTTPERMSILISGQRNKSVGAYAETLLHELLHVWLNMLGRKGFNVDEESKEEFADKAEQSVIRLFNKTF